MPDKLPPEQTMFYYRAYREPTSGEYYSLRNPDTGLWSGEKIPAILIDGPPSAGAGKGSKMAKMRKLRAKR